jgi:hypothetical protein
MPMLRHGEKVTVLTKTQNIYYGELHGDYDGTGPVTLLKLGAKVMVIPGDNIENVETR